MYLYGTSLYQHSTNDYIYLGPGGADYFGWAAGLNSWYYLALTYSGNAYTAKLYVNGAMKNINIQTGGDISAFSNRISNNTLAFNGLIDDVRAYNQVIPTSQIQQNYYSGLNNLFRSKEMVKSEYLKNLSELKQSLVNNN